MVEPAEQNLDDGLDDDGGLDVLLRASSTLIEESSAIVDELGAESTSTTRRLDDLDSRADQLLARLSAKRREAEQRSTPAVRRSDHASWSDASLRERAAANLSQRGIDPNSVDLDQLLDPAEVVRIRKRFAGEIAVSARLDRSDVAMAIVAGLVGGLVDQLLVATPASSPLTAAVKRLALPSDNWLAGLAKVPYDVAWNGELWLTPRYHRVQTMGHDPLLGLVWGTADIMRQTCTGVRPDGTLAVIGNAGDYPSTWPAALARQIMHTLSDAPTASGVPLPGWGVLAAMPSRDGDRNLAQAMYSQGYDSWHFITMSTVPATVELLCRSYWAIRSTNDPDFDGQGVDSVADHPRYQALSLAAHGVSALVDFGNFAATGSNPLALNYSQWLMLAKKAVAFANRDRVHDLADVALRNQRSLETGWPSSASTRGDLIDE